MQKDKMQEFFNNVNTQLMVTAAHRYCLGRQTYIVSSAVEWLWENRKYFEPKTIAVMVRDTIEAIRFNRAGDKDIDLPQWKKLVFGLIGEMSDDEKKKLLESLALRYTEFDAKLNEFFN
jgi:hypothetical protein